MFCAATAMVMAKWEAIEAAMAEREAVEATTAAQSL
jgi:hypothetical protein